MKIAFDCDGVLSDIDPSHLKLIHNMPESPEKVEAEIIYYRDRTPLINPRFYLADDDEYYIITSRHEGLREITERYVNKWFPDCSGLYIVGGDPILFNSDYEAWKDMILEKKIELIEELGIDVFFDDNPELVVKYRKRLKIPVIKYGTRL